MVRVRVCILLQTKIVLNQNDKTMKIGVCVQQFPNFHVFIFQLCVHPCHARCACAYDVVALSRPPSLSPSSLCAYYLHECVLVIERRHSLTLSFSAMNFWLLNILWYAAFRPKIFQNL